MDILVNGGEYLEDVEFPAVTPIVALPADTYEVAITVANNPGAIAFGPADLPLAAGTWYSVFATDFNASLDAAAGELVLKDYCASTMRHRLLRTLTSTSSPRTARLLA